VSDQKKSPDLKNYGTTWMIVKKRLKDRS